MKYICLGYIDENKWAAISESERNAIMDACFSYDDVLRRKAARRSRAPATPPHCAGAMAESPRPTVLMPRPKSNWAVFSYSKRGT